MIVSRLAGICKISARKNLLLQNNRNDVSKIFVRNGHDIHFMYRKTPSFDDTKCNKAVILGTITWWWLFWNMFTNYQSLLGHRYPEPSEWTDEELGIADDE